MRTMIRVCKIVSLVCFCVLLVIFLFCPNRLVAELNTKRTLYQYDTLDANELNVYTVNRLGLAKKIASEKVFLTNAQLSDAVNEVQVNVWNEWGSFETNVDISPIMVSDVRCEYTSGKAYEGESLHQDCVETVAVFEDGTEKMLTECRFNPQLPNVFGQEDVDLDVSTVYGDTNLHIPVIPVDHVNMVVPDDVLQGDVLDNEDVELNAVYSDGRRVNLEITSDLSENGGMRNGENEYIVHYLNRTFECSILADPRTRVSLAKRALKDEIQQADYDFYSDDILTTVTEHTAESGGTYLLTHVIVNDPAQLQGALSNNTLGGSRERPSTASRRIPDWVVGTNGSYFNYEYGEPTMYAHVLLHGGKLYRDYPSGTTGHEICKRSDGTLFTPASGLHADDLLKLGVTDVWGTCDPVLIENGKMNSDLAGRNPGRHPRTGLGMVKPGEYYLLSSNTGSYRGGLSYSECQKIFSELGCTYARTLDGGGSSSLALNGKLINKTATGSERPVADFLFFSSQKDDAF